MGKWTSKWSHGVGAVSCRLEGNQGWEARKREHQPIAWLHGPTQAHDHPEPLYPYSQGARVRENIVEERKAAPEGGHDGKVRGSPGGNQCCSLRPAQRPGTSPFCASVCLSLQWTEYAGPYSLGPGLCVSNAGFLLLELTE